MIVVAEYSFNRGKEFIDNNFLELKKEIYSIISSVKAENCKIKRSKEKTMSGKLLYSPTCFNREYKKEFITKKWQIVKIKCNYSDAFYLTEFRNFYKNRVKGAFRGMDYVKDQLGVEVQFGKYAFMAYNVCAKMTIFHKEGIIKAGVEIVPVKNLADNMSTGVSYFEQFVWDLEKRGVSNIDIPVLILGVDSESVIEGLNIPISVY